MHLYHRERLALLKCVAVLGTQKAYVFDGENDDGFGGNGKEGEEASLSHFREKLEEMIKNGLEDNIVNYLCDSLLANGEGLGLLAIGSSREEKYCFGGEKSNIDFRQPFNEERNKQAHSFVRKEKSLFV